MGSSILERKELEILDVLREAGRPLGARQLARRLKERGIELTERAVGYHLASLDRRGLTRLDGGRGHSPTPAALEELERSLAPERVGFVSSRIDSLAFRSTFDPERRSGTLPVNISLVPANHLRRALELMATAMRAGYCLSELVLLRREGERLGNMEIPPGKCGIGTVCSVALNGVLLKRGVPVASRFGGLLEVERGRPLRFLEIIGYDHSTLDPIEIFIKGKMTGVAEAVAGRRGVVCASFREIPSDATTRVLEALEAMRGCRMAGAVHLGRPGQHFLQVPVGKGRMGLVVIGGLNPLALVEESGIPSVSKAMVSLVDYEEFAPMQELRG
jgi:repressor of nif and glnA expression